MPLLSPLKETGSEGSLVYYLSQRYWVLSPQKDVLDFQTYDKKNVMKNECPSVLQ